MSRLGAAKKRAQRGARERWERWADAQIAWSIIGRPPHLADEPSAPTPVPSSQGHRARMLVLGLLLVACVAWWALALWEVLR